MAQRDKGQPRPLQSTAAGQPLGEGAVLPQLLQLSATWTFPDLKQEGSFQQKHIWSQIKLWDLLPFIKSPVRTHGQVGGCYQPFGVISHVPQQTPQQSGELFYANYRIPYWSDWVRETSVLPAPCVDKSDLEVPCELGFCLAHAWVKFSRQVS